MSTTLYWHDYETFGRNPRWSGIAQFAGIRTDMELNELGEPLMVYCKPPQDSWPDPVACLITGITPQHCQQYGLPEPAFAKTIMQELGKPSTCGVGFNSIRFDDEFTRHLLYRNFYDPYEREWKHGNSRWDLLDVLRMARALRPEGIVWPFDDEGIPVMKLERLTAANGIAQVGAHDALVDVRATIAMAKLLRHAQPKLFDYAFTLRNKKVVADLFDWSTHRPLLHTSSRFGSQRLATTLVMPLMKTPSNNNGILVFDLMQDPAALIDLPATEIRKRVFTATRDMEEGTERLAIKTVHINKLPMLAVPSLLNGAVEERIGLDRARCERHWQQLLKVLPAVKVKLAEVFSRAYDNAIQDAEFLLYDGFFSEADNRVRQSVRQATVKALTDDTFVFEDARLKELLFRYRARHFPASLTEQELAQWNEFRCDRLEKKVSPDWITAQEYVINIAELSASHANERDQQILKALKQWMTEMKA
jgi:exodeoxyribonuclease-1